jgi:hypothetical protein
MPSAFADTFYFLALRDSSEQRHIKAVEASRNPELRLVTTDWVLTEFGDASCQPKDRADFVALYRSRVNHPRVKSVAAETRLSQRGVDLFEQQKDLLLSAQHSAEPTAPIVAVSLRHLRSAAEHR